MPDGVRLRGRGLRSGIPELTPDRSVFLLGRRPPPVPWPSVWVRWPDFAVPLSWRQARLALLDAHERARVERLEIVCAGGKGRTGTALACLASLSLTPSAAVEYVRMNYNRHAIEMPWQRLFITWFHYSTTRQKDSFFI